jgi:DNA-directed RNA polymerase specialized sigma24 family protein
MKQLDALKQAFANLQTAKDNALLHNLIDAQTDDEKKLARECSAVKKQAQAHYDEVYAAFDEALNGLPEIEQTVIAKQALQYVSY